MNRDRISIGNESQAPPLGYHTLLELYGCAPERLVNAGEIEPALVDAVRQAGGTVVRAFFHNFQPIGVSGVVVIQESHVTIHTWPEHRYAAVDVFTCGTRLRIDQLSDRLRVCLGATRSETMTIERGCLPVG